MVFLWYICQIWCVLFFFSPWTHFLPSAFFLSFEFNDSLKIIPTLWLDRNITWKKKPFSGKYYVPPPRRSFCLKSYITDCNSILFSVSNVYKAGMQTQKYTFGADNSRQSNAFLHPTACMCWQRLILEGICLVSKTFSCSLFDSPLCIHSSVFSLPTCIPSHHGLFSKLTWTKTWSAWISVVFVCFVERNTCCQRPQLVGALMKTPAQGKGGRPESVDHLAP